MRVICSDSGQDSDSGYNKCIMGLGKNRRSSNGRGAKRKVTWHPMDFPFLRYNVRQSQAGQHANQISLQYNVLASLTSELLCLYILLIISECFAQKCQHKAELKEQFIWITNPPQFFPLTPGFLAPSLFYLWCLKHCKNTIKCISFQKLFFTRKHEGPLEISTCSCAVWIFSFCDSDDLIL